MIYETIKLKELIAIDHGYAFDGHYITDKDSDPILVTPGNFKIGGGFKNDKNKHYSGSIPKDFIFTNGDLVVTMTDLSVDCDTLGYPAIIPDCGQFLHNQRIGKIRLISNRIDKMFLYYQLQLKEYHHYVKSTCTGTAIHHTSPSTILKYTLKLPTIDNQRKIANMLNHIDSKIAVVEKINDNLHHLAYSIFERYQESATYSCTVADLAKEIVCGKTPVTSRKENYGGNIPFITIPDMHGHSMIVRTERYLSAEGANTQPKKELPRHAVCVSCIATPGLVSLTLEASHTNQQINSVICKDAVSPLYAYFLLSSMSETIIALGTGGSATLNLNKEEFSKMEILSIDFL